MNTSMLDKLWYTDHPLRWLLFPLSMIYEAVSWCRRVYLTLFLQQCAPVPVIVVGNLTVGGVGKTPLVIALVKRLQAKGLRVGVVSRGYGACIHHFPHQVDAHDTAARVGDEPFLIAKKTNAPVVIAPKRMQAVRYLVDHCQSQIIISDDGLQHYAMGRAIEIVVIDGRRGMGNGLCLPAGPLRERPSRLKSADFVVVNSGSWLGAYPMELIPGEFTSLYDGGCVSKASLGQSIAAVAGIGHPQRFFNTLDAMQLSYKPYVFPDHYSFNTADLRLNEPIVVMTEKDAVKCEGFATAAMYFLPIEAVLGDDFWTALWAHQQLKGYI